MSKVDYLTEDSLTPADQKFVCISYLKDDSNKNLTGIKIRGVFDTYNKACEFSKKLHDTDPYFDVYVGEMGKWLPIYPNTDNVEETVHSDEKLNNIMKNYIKNQEQARLLFEQRKNELMKDNVISNIVSNNERLQNEEIDSKAVEAINDNIKELDKKREELEANIDNVTKQINKLQ